MVSQQRRGGQGGGREWGKASQNRVGYCTKVKNLQSCCVSCSVVSDSATPWTVACQAPLSKEFARQEYWSGSPFPSPGDLSDPGIEPWSPAL